MAEGVLCKYVGVGGLTNLGDEDQTDRKSGGEEREQRDERVGRVELILNHDCCRHSDQTEHYDIVDADACNQTP